PKAATDRARRAQRLFRVHGREVWELRAALVVAEARYASGQRTAALLGDVAALAGQLDALRASEGQPAHPLAGRVARDLARAEAADEHLDLAARARRAAPALRRSRGWLAVALRSEAHALARQTVVACGRGLDALDEHLMSLGATELRAHATAHGAELAGLAQRDALRRGGPRRLLAWSERWRATLLAVPPVRPPDDTPLVAQLAAVGDVVRRLDQVRTGTVAVRGGDPDRGQTLALERERRRLETAVRSRILQTRGRVEQQDRFDLVQLRESLGEHRLVELVDIDGQ